MIVRIKHAYRITSIADFISARYNKSQALAALVTVIALIGVIPYVALQLRATFTTFNILAMHSYKGNVSALEQYMAWLIILLMIVLIQVGMNLLPYISGRKLIRFWVAMV